MSYVLVVGIVVLLIVAIILFYIQRYKVQLEDYFNKLLKFVWRSKGDENAVHPTLIPTWAPEYVRLQEQEQEDKELKEKKERMLSISARFKLVVSTMQITSNSKFSKSSHVILKRVISCFSNSISLFAQVQSRFICR